MKPQRLHDGLYHIPNNRLAILIVLGILSSGSTWLIWRLNIDRWITPTIATTQMEARTGILPQIPVTVAELPGSQAQVTIAPQSYWLQTTGNRIELVAVAMPRPLGKSDVSALRDAIDYLLVTPYYGNLASTIPSGTRLLGLQMKPDGIHLDLSREFASGGGSTSMIYRVAQVIYTATSLDSKAKVYLSVEGKLLNQDHPLGGEGLILSQPLTRQQVRKGLDRP
jgi:spore germination protein GerM